MIETSPALVDARDREFAVTTVEDTVVTAPRRKPPLVTAYGLKWKLYEAEWPKSPRWPIKLRLLARRSHGSSRKVADFYSMPGFYALLFRGKPVYFGIAPDRGVGARIRDHLKDNLAGKW